MKFLPDVNVIFPMLVSRHIHRTKAIEWFDTAKAEEVALCRIVRLGTLRLLCTSQIMGLDVLQPKEAFAAMESLEVDERIVLVHEPDDLDFPLKKFVTPRTASPNLWTDAYLAAFAYTAGLRLVSFDRGFSKFTGIDLQTLSA